MVAHAGYDWVMLDMEHAPSDMASVLGQLQAFSGSETTAMVRPDWNDAVKVKRLMDLGAPGLLFPMVQTPDEARAAVAACRYPPRGIRGVAGLNRANQFGRVADYNAEVENQTVILIQLETRAAVENAAAFAEVEGIDGIFFGPADIAADLGHLGQTLHPEVWEVIRPAAKTLMDKGIPVGTLVTDPNFAAQLLNEGFTFVACGTDVGLLAQGADALRTKVRDKISET